MIRDEEIERLTNYIKGLGLKVTFSSKKKDLSAQWYLDNSEIEINKRNNKAKIDMVLSLIHETAHALHNIHEKNRELDPKFEKALTHVDDAAELEVDSKKRQRKIILDNEIAGTKYWHSIYRETNMKFPIWILEAQMEYDIWQYQIWYENGEDPMLWVRKIKYKVIRAEHRRRYESS